MTLTIERHFMEKYKIACMYYPTTVVLVDDSPTVLQNLQLKIGKVTPCKTFSVPEEALSFIKNASTAANALKTAVGIDVESRNYTHDSEQLPLQYNVSNIHQKIYDPNRFLDISLVVVDYAMPSMDGEKFCRELRELKGNTIKIIMLTGEADDAKGIELFNSGVIDRFLRKAQPNLDVDLKNCILEMQKIYFRDISFPIIQGLLSDESSSLGDPAFIALFEKVCQEVSATSYFLIEISGSFILFDEAGKPTWLIIKSLEELEEIASQIEPQISESLVDSISNGEVVPYFGSSELEYYADEEKLKTSLHKAQKLNGKKVYCYAVLDRLPEFDLERDKIVSFNQYVGSL